MECVLSLAAVVLVFVVLGHFQRKTAARNALIEQYTEASLVDLDPDGDGGFTFDADLDAMTARFVINEYGHEPKHYMLKRRADGGWRMKYTLETAIRLLEDRSERWGTHPYAVQDKLAETAEEDLPAFERRAKKWQQVGDAAEHELERCWQLREDLRPLLRPLRSPARLRERAALPRDWLFVRNHANVQVGPRCPRGGLSELGP